LDLLHWREMAKKPPSKKQIEIWQNYLRAARVHRAHMINAIKDESLSNHERMTARKRLKRENQNIRDLENLLRNV
jgi:flagellar biosynthesis protein FliP